MTCVEPRIQNPTSEANPASATAPLITAHKKPRLGFLGVGWIGRHRMAALAQSGVADVVGIADTSPETAAEASRLVPRAAVLDSVEALLESDADGIVIATPSALHANQAVAALAQGKAVFCQKPLGRTGEETRRVIRVARKSDLLLGVDLSYRFMTSTRRIRELCRQGELGEIYSIDLVFHNAYGPDKAWFYERGLSGGGCLIDLGIHLVDLALWCLDYPRVLQVTSRLFAQGKPLKAQADLVEDHAVARLDLANGATITLACSWKLPVGRDAQISGCFYGTKGGAAFHNINGSFYDFAAERFHGTKREVLAEGPEDWGGRAAVDWAQRLSRGMRFAPEVEKVGEVAQTLDAIYEAAGMPGNGAARNGETSGGGNAKDWGGGI
jgi:predicted dehydrogenase